MNDLKFAFRQLLQNPGFTAVSVLTLALGLGACTAMFSVINAIVLRPLPFEEPERIVRVWETNLKRDISYFSASIPNYVDWNERSRSWEALAATTYRNLNFTGGDEPEVVQAQFMTANFLEMLRLRPALGRTFLPEEDQPGRNHVVIVADSFWRRQLGSDPNAIGSSINLNGKAHTIIGIAPAKFGMAGELQMFLPLGADLAREDRGDHEIDVYGRLKPGVTLLEAEAELKTIAARIERENPDSNDGWSVRLEPLFRVVIGEKLQSSLFVLLGAVALLLVIACANVSNLLLARTATRTRELAIRVALGGGRLRLMAQMLTESVVLSTLGGAVGVLLATWSVSWMRSLSLPRAAEISIDWRVLLFAAVATMLAGILPGLVPLFQTGKVDVQHALKEVGRGSAAGRNRLQSGLVVAQIALSLVLLVGAGLLLRSFHSLQQVNLGFNPKEVLTLRIAPTAGALRFYQRLMDPIRALPGVQSAGLSSRVPLSGFNTSLNLFPVGAANIPADQSVQADWRIIGPGFFEAIQAPLLQGRMFTDGDDQDAPRVVVVNRTLAHRLWGDENPVGRQVNPGGGTNYSTVIGVVGDIRGRNPALAPNPTYYRSVNQGVWGPMTLAVRSAGDAAQLVAAIRKEVKALDPGLPLFEVSTLEELLGASLAQPKWQTELLGAFAVLALLLATVGLYGVTAYSVSQRTKEIGIRMALGAQRAGVVSLILRQGLKLAGLGVCVGVPAAFLLTRLIRNLLFGVGPADPVTFVSIPFLLAAATMLACWCPARRATKVNPMEALRTE